MPVEFNLRWEDDYCLNKLAVITFQLNCNKMFEIGVRWKALEGACIEVPQFPTDKLVVLMMSIISLKNNDTLKYGNPRSGKLSF